MRLRRSRRRVVFVHVPRFTVFVRARGTWHEIEVTAANQQVASTRAEQQLGFTSEEVSETRCSPPYTGLYEPIRGHAE